MAERKVVSQAQIDRAVISLHRKIERAVLGANHNIPDRLVNDLIDQKLSEIRPCDLTSELFCEICDDCELIVKNAGFLAPDELPSFSPRPR